METGPRATGALATDEPPDGRLGLTPHVSPPAEPVRLRDLDLPLLEDVALSGVEAVVQYVHAACLAEFRRVAQPLGVELDKLEAVWVFTLSWATWPGLAAVLEVKGPRVLAIEWLEKFGWLVTERASERYCAAEVSGGVDVVSLERATRRWHPERMRECCG